MPSYFAYWKSWDVMLRTLRSRNLSSSLSFSHQGLFHCTYCDHVSVHWSPSNSAGFLRLYLNTGRSAVQHVHLWSCCSICNMQVTCTSSLSNYFCFCEDNVGLCKRICWFNWWVLINILACNYTGDISLLPSSSLFPWFFFFFFLYELHFYSTYYPFVFPEAGSWIHLCAFVCNLFLSFLSLCLFQCCSLYVLVGVMSAPQSITTWGKSNCLLARWLIKMTDAYKHI